MYSGVLGGIKPQPLHKVLSRRFPGPAFVWVEVIFMRVYHSVQNIKSL